MKQLRSKIILFAIISALASCTTLSSYQEPYPIVAEPSSNKMVKDFIQTYPSDFKIVHRVILRAAGSDFDFTGYFLMKRPGLIVMSAFAEAGAPIFEIQKNMKGIVVVRKPAQLPEIVMREGVVGDLLHIYEDYPESSWRLVAKTDSHRTFQTTDADKQISEFTFNKDGQLVNSTRVVDGKIVTKITYSEPKILLPKTFTPMPSQIVVENHQFKYRMDITVIEASPKLPATFDEIIFESAKGIE
jgi:hypothetical protein